MTEISQDIHKTLSVQCFNACWDLIEKPDRSVDDDENMLLLASTSLWHWQQRDDCRALNLSVGYWQMARVHTLAGDYSLAERYAERCREVSEIGIVSAMYLGYAYEALARLEALRGNGDVALKHIGCAREILEQLTDPEERKLLAMDLDTIIIEEAT